MVAHLLQHHPDVLFDRTPTPIPCPCCGDLLFPAPGGLVCECGTYVATHKVAA